MKTISAALCGMLLFGASIAHADTFFLNYEAPGVEYSTATFSVKGLETFDSLSTGFQSFSTDFGTNGAIMGSYTNVQINNADQYGGAGGTGKYAVAFGSTPYSVSLVADAIKDPQGINYFGFWLSALDVGNQVTFYKGGVEVGALSPGQVTSAVSADPGYFGNPSGTFHYYNPGQPYVFINFYDLTGTFDKVAFTESPAVGGYESDNQTVGYFTALGGVPEPTTWALMLVGFGLLGGGLRRRHARCIAT